MTELEMFPLINRVVIPEDPQLSHYKISFVLDGSNVALANALRRSMLSEIPNVGFDLSGDNSSETNSIYIKENTSVLHNEFLAHRLAMIPICTYRSGELNLMSQWNPATGIRDSRFLGKLPEFLLSVKNTPEYQESLGKSSNPTVNKKLDKTSIHITSGDFMFGSEEVAKIQDFIVPDHITKEFIYLNKLKVLPDGSGEAIQIRCQLSVGTGKVHSLYSPVGTVAYSLAQAPSEEIEHHRKLYLEALQQERTEKGLNPYTGDELRDINHTYNHLESKRVYQRNTKGEPSTFKFQVESIGGMYPPQIVSFAIQGLLWRVRDIRSCLAIKDSVKIGSAPEYSLNEMKLEIVTSPGKMNSYDIMIDNEDHTIGNLVSKCLAELFSKNGNHLLSFVSYTKLHPLQDKIFIRVQVNPEIGLIPLWAFISEQSDILDPKLSKQLEDMDWSQDEEGLLRFTTLFMFEQGLQYVITVLNRLLFQWETVANPIIDSGCKNKNFIRFANEATVQSEEEQLHILGVDGDGIPMYQRLLQYQPS